MNKTAFIAIVGKPNVGKSSILNKILGQKIAIVSSKPQTTRTRIMGVLTENDTQLVFIDTPGLHKPRNNLDKFMLRSVNESVAGVDACILVIEADRDISDETLQLIDKFTDGIGKELGDLVYILRFPDPKHLAFSAEDQNIGLKRLDHDLADIIKDYLRTARIVKKFIDLAGFV